MLEPGLPIRNGAVLSPFRSPVARRLLIALELVERRQQRPGLAVSESKMAYAAADRGLEPDPAFCFGAGFAQLVRDGEAARLHSIERLTQHLANAFGALDRDDVPGERDQVAPEAVIDKQAGSRIDVPRSQDPLEVRQPPRDVGSCSRGVELSIRDGIGHRGTPSGGVWRFGGATAPSISLVRPAATASYRTTVSERDWQVTTPAAPNRRRQSGPDGVPHSERARLSPVPVQLRSVGATQALRVPQEPVVESPRPARLLLRDQQLFHQAMQLLVREYHVVHIRADELSRAERQPRRHVDEPRAPRDGDGDALR